MRTLLIYLVINILVSACTTAGVLFLYDRYYRPSTIPVVHLEPDTANASLEIITIVGADIPTSEMVLIHNTGSTAVLLKGWQLQDADANIYTFGDITIQPDGAIQVHTAPGENTQIDLYWGLPTSTWSSGETATLIDSSGTLHSVYQVP